MDSNSHKTALGRMCRVCGDFLNKSTHSTKPYECAAYKQQLKDTFDINIDSDHKEKHPSCFCRGCYDVIRTRNEASQNQKIYKETKKIFSKWDVHMEVACSVCDHFSKLSKGGRPKKSKGGGRPPLVGYRSAVTHVRKIAPPTFLPVADPLLSLTTPEPSTINDLKCPVCTKIVDRPIELSTCGKLICSECLAARIESACSLTCPLCDDDHLKNFTTIRAASSLVINVLKQLRVNCKSCSTVVHLANYIPHIDSGCKHYREALITVQDVMQKPLDSPLLPSEEQLQSRLTKRSLATSPEDNILRVKTRGQVTIDNTQGCKYVYT